MHISLKFQHYIADNGNDVSYVPIEVVTARYMLWLD